MARSVLLLCLVSGLAFGEARAFQVQPGTEVSVRHPDWIFTLEGKARVDAKLVELMRTRAQLEAENASLRADVLAMSKMPALTWRGVLVLVGGGIVIGAAIGIPVALAVRR